MNTLRAKIALLYKTEAEWKVDGSYIPLKGEMCFCEFPADESGHQDVMFKIGNGKNTFNDLKWAMMMAPDYE